MNPRLHSDLTSALERDYEFKHHSGYLRGGRCPACGKKELYANEESPWVLRCGRLNKCGAEYHVKDLYSELFTNWSERHPVTPDDPNAAADAYMRDGRGFDLSKVRGWYTQESYYNPELKIGSATVRFTLPSIGYWERLIDRPERFGKRKATFRGDYKGHWWSAPGLDLTAESVKEIWVVEGIFDSIALRHHDVASATPLSCNNYPDKALKSLAEQCAALGRKRPRLVWAMDTGKAGERFTRKFVDRSRDEGWNAVAAQPPDDGKLKLDWNELHQRDKLTPKMLEESLYRGALLVAKSAHEKAVLIFNHGREISSFYFGYDNRMYWFDLSLEKFAKTTEELTKAYEDCSEQEIREMAMKESHTLREIANCYFTALYYQANLLTDESWYYLRVDFPHSGESVNNTFTGAMLTSSSEFKKRLLSIAPGAVYTGNGQQLDRIMQRQLFNIKTVQTIDFVGYTKEHGAWVFGDVAVLNGKLVTLNDEDFFDIGKLSIKSLNRSVDLSLNTDLNDFSRDWFELLWQCYHFKGVAALAFWMGSLFAEQIRHKHKSFPFIELVGEPGAGKSTLIEFLWRLLGRSDYEGFDPSKSTMAARARNFSQVSNMPVVLIEGDRTEEDRVKQKGFDWDELKPLYNGRSVYSRGVKNSGNETHEPPFRGALVISQNANVNASDAIMQRICHIGFDLASHTQESKEAADRLGQIGVEALSGFLIKATLAEKAILASLEERLPYHEKRLLKVQGVRNLRIVKNHAMLAALVDALSHVIHIGNEERSQTHAFIEEMTIERQEAINADHPTVQNFWEIYEFLNGNDETPRLNHARNEERQIAINLNHFIEVATDRRQQIPDMNELKKLLKTSRTHKFVGIKTVNSAINAAWNARRRNEGGDEKPATVKCWVFENPSHKR
ncbi:MAG: toprim domain-containing protein [Nitrosomonadales bacterium]|nr:toprim domain-containing protein [Nitrosomonadales bacterium]